MKFFHLVWRGLLRRKLRTLFTALSIFIAFLLFGALMALRVAFGNGCVDERLRQGGRGEEATQAIVGLALTPGRNHRPVVGGRTIS